MSNSNRVTGEYLWLDPHNNALTDLLALTDLPAFALSLVLPPVGMLLKCKFRYSPD